ncbi:hypothetical protein Kpol_1066p17 [Vanderwaltozyma polyspora DSM 70294]|uniref:Protein-lysine N-methyltransferase EFM2 n=1 Tax=Vanderwaltozyma polyspora (strain ATCC 22028 / DSM 70294 / BCRC 21397 / CBS 2163 / NBRC 10782 / NRRL Y-8283 / UCD 57-17) TaxID=436907 RepID=A7TMN9_VANPO|nr:uncharacterized protein Kpol_1066p17 [Vanderwaltozyma polyspora DSM 70294]EDO16453.1 hypothetical protein Kpol_1066p17 [Vanderwaltozyma polyspora DSM 70294]
MFDPLDMYDADSQSSFDEGLELFNPLNRERNDNYVKSKSDELEILKGVEQEDEDEDEDSIVEVLDLPSVHYAKPEVILCILLLLRPDVQVNFQKKQVDNDESDVVSRTCKEKGISNEILLELVKWYTDIFPNSNLNSTQKLCLKIPQVKNTSTKELLLNYYTSILKKFEMLQSNDTNNIDDQIIESILKESSLRVSENCGRTAQPSMTREFKMDNLDQTVKLYEPSLTADNLGWKTWGSSLILSQKMVNFLNNYKYSNQSDDKLRILELGAGTGLVGISWSCKWKEMMKLTNGNNLPNTEIILTDLPEIVGNLQRNISINNLNDIARASVLDWTNPKSFIQEYSNEKFDIILVADPIYSPKHPEWVTTMISTFLKSNNDARCYLQLPIRAKYKEERSKLWELLKHDNLKTVSEEQDVGTDDWGTVEYIFKELSWE